MILDLKVMGLVPSVDRDHTPAVLSMALVLVQNYDDSLRVEEQ